MKKVMCIVGARPNFMKIAPVMRALCQCESVIPSLVHTGQHYDDKMKYTFFDQLGIPEPDIDLEVGSGSHAVQTADIMKRFELVLDKEKPDAILVVGDVNSTIACALVSAKKNVPVFHVEAGLRSRDMAMPEEINRLLTDQLSALLFTTEASARENLLREGISEDKVHFVGNVMIDTLKAQIEKAIPPNESLSSLTDDSEIFLNSKEGYSLLTLHRPSNVDNPEVLEELLLRMRVLSERTPIIFPVHPRTAERIRMFDLAKHIDLPTILQVQPLGYLEMLGLMAKARMILTDSGGLQEESTALGVPCITLRENTERPITVEQGTNTIVGVDTVRIQEVFDDVLNTGGKRGRIPELWDGKAATRIADVICKWMNISKP